MGDAGILVVCTANICRSALAAGVLRRSLRDGSGWAAALPVESAGAATSGGSVMCAHALQAARDDGVPEPDLAGHRSRPLDVEQLRGAGLILTMEPDHLRAISALAPGLQTRTFLLDEAAALATLAAARGGAPRSSLAAVADTLHGLRGMADPPTRGTPLARLIRRRAAPIGFGIRDGHNLPGGAHRSTLRETAGAARRFGEALTALAGSAAAGPPQR